MHELMTVMVTWLAINFGLPDNHEHPNVKMLPAQEIAETRYRIQLGNGRHAMKPVSSSDLVAFYDDAQEVIFMRDSWDIRSPADQSVLVHEMVHHLQTKAQLRYPCAQAREELAFEAQTAWLDLFGMSLESEFGLNGLTILMRTKFGS